MDINLVNMGVLALSDKLAFSGILCLAAIPILIIGLIPFSKGFIVGSGTNCVLWIICVLCLAAPENAVDGAFVNAVANNDSGYIANRSQTKWMRKDHANISEDGCSFLMRGTRTVDNRDDEDLYVPAEEIFIKDGWKMMKSTGKRITEDDRYIYSKVYSSTNVGTVHGGSGIPQWIWHPAAPIYIFGLLGLPAFLGGMLISSKL